MTIGTPAPGLIALVHGRLYQRAPTLHVGVAEGVQISEKHGEEIAGPHLGLK